MEQGLIRDWQWGVEVESGQPADVYYRINGRTYTHTGAVKLVKDFEVAYGRCLGGRNYFIAVKPSYSPAVPSRRERPCALLLPIASSQRAKSASGPLR